MICKANIISEFDHSIIETIEVSGNLYYEISNSIIEYMVNKGYDVNQYDYMIIEKVVIKWKNYAI